MPEQSAFGGESQLRHRRCSRSPPPVMNEAIPRSVAWRRIVWRAHPTTRKGIKW